MHDEEAHISPTPHCLGRGVGVTVGARMSVVISQRNLRVRASSEIEVDVDVLQLAFPSFSEAFANGLHSTQVGFPSAVITTYYHDL